MVVMGGFDAGSWADLLWRGIFVRITAAGYGTWKNIHVGTLAWSCGMKKVHGGKSRHMDEYSR